MPLPAAATTGSPLVAALEQELERLGAAHRLLRAGSVLARAGEPVTVSLQPFPASLQVTMLVDAAIELVGKLTGPITGTLGVDLPATKLTGQISTITGALLTLVSQPNANPLKLDPMSGTVTAVQGAADPLVSAVESLPGEGLRTASPLKLPVTLPVSVSVAWIVERETGTNAKGQITTEVLSPGEGFEILEGATSSVLSLVFLPRFVPLGDLAVPPPDVCRLSARITLSVDPTGLALLAPVLVPLLGEEPITKTVTVGPIPVIVPVLPLPQLAVLFRHEQLAQFQGDEEGYALVVVPKSSPIQAIAQVTDAVAPLVAALQALVLLPLAAAVLAPLRGLLTAAQAITGNALLQPHVRLLPGDFHDDLKKVVMIKESRFGSDALNRDVRAGRTASALLLVGPEGSGIHLFNGESRKSSATADKGDLAITVGPENYAFVRDLESDAPRSEPPGRADPGVVPGARNTYDNDVESFELIPPTRN